MTTTLFVLIITAVVVAFWSAGRAAAEVATIHGRHACTAAGVQWLDQSVHLLSIRLRRNGEGRLAWERQFQFEYSSGGDDRHAGRLVMQGTRLIATFGPMPKAAADERPLGADPAR